MSRAKRSVIPTESEFADCLVKVRAGDEKVIGELVQRYLPYLRATLLQQTRRVCGLRDENADILQMAMLRAIERFYECHASTERQFRSWLVRILLNYLAKTRREKRYRPRPLDNCPEPVDPAIEQWAELQREREVAVAEALSQLNDNEQLLVIWHYIQRWSWTAICESSGRSKGAVQRSGARALQKIEGALHEIAPELFCREFAKTRQRMR